MGVGDPLEASYELAGAIPAGKWVLIGDGIVLAEEVDIRFEVLWEEQVIVTFDHHFTRPEGEKEHDAVAFDASADAPMIPALRGERLIFRMSASGASPGPAWLPNTDGEITKGRIPSIDLP